ncbi:MAG TPA: hypothetical protein VF339_11115 [Gammaproteobacteria bacterium]
MTGFTRPRSLDVLQLATAVGTLVLLLQIYPSGALLAFAVVVGLCYVAASILAMRGTPVGVWLAFAFTLAVFAFTVWGVYRYLDNGFEFLSGNFPGRSGIYWPAYLFLLIAVGSLAVIVLSVSSLRNGRSTHRAASRGGPSESTSRRPPAA